MAEGLTRGHGSGQPTAFLIADGAYSDDITTGYALSGYQSTMLKKLCSDVNLTFKDFWSTCLIKEGVKKPVSSIKDAIELQPLVKTYGPYLIDEINTLQPHLLIPLGETSFQFLTGLQGIRKFRGSILQTEGSIGVTNPTKVLPILGPNPYLYQDPKLKHISRIDFNKISRYLNDAPIPDNYFKIWVAHTSSELRVFLERSYKAEGLLVFDIETFAQIPTCISFCFDGFESVCVPFLDSSIDLDSRVLMIDLVARILNSPIRKVNQNIKYDWKILERWGFSVRNVVGDTMLAANTLYCEFPKNLGFLTSIYTDLPYFKDEGREFDPSKHRKEQFYLYNAKDSLATHQIHTRQQTEVDEQGVRFIHDQLIKCIPVYRRMEDRGIRVDDEARTDLLAKYENLYEIEKLKLKNLSGFDINPLSPRQVRKLVYDEIAYRVIRGVKRSPTGEPSTDEETLNLLMAFSEPKRTHVSGKEALKSIINCRKLHKVIEIANLPLYPDGRFRCEFNLAGTETGRTSAGETTDKLLVLDRLIRLKNLGHSLQTIGKHGFYIDGVSYGKDIRNIFVASHGYTLVECDLSGAEARVDRVLSGCFDLSVFDNPGIHKLTGSWVFGCKPEEIKKGTHQYHLAKTVRHAGERNMKADRFYLMAQDEGLDLHITLKECDIILDTFHKYQPEIRDVFHHDVIAAINATLCLIAPNGRRRDFFDRIDAHTYNEGISQLPQGIVSDKTKFSLIPTFDECSWAYLLSEAHDGALAEVPIGREQKYIEAYKRNIETPIDFRNGSLKRDYQLVIPCEASTGENWGQLEEVD